MPAQAIAQRKGVCVERHYVENEINLFAEKRDRKGSLQFELELYARKLPDIQVMGITVKTDGCLLYTRADSKGNIRFAKDKRPEIPDEMGFFRRGITRIHEPARISKVFNTVWEGETQFGIALDQLAGIVRDDLLDEHHDYRTPPRRLGKTVALEKDLNEYYKMCSYVLKPSISESIVESFQTVFRYV